MGTNVVARLIPHCPFFLGRPYRREYLIRRMYRHSKNHRLRTQSKAAVFCLYQSEHVTAKPPSKKQAFLQYAFVPSRHNRRRHFRAASKTKSKPNAAGSVGKERATACARSDFCKKSRSKRYKACSDMVEARRVELLSENQSARLSTSVAALFRFPWPPAGQQAGGFGSS